MQLESKKVMTILESVEEEMKSYSTGGFVFPEGWLCACSRVQREIEKIMVVKDFKSGLSIKRCARKYKMPIEKVNVIIRESVRPGGRK